SAAAVCDYLGVASPELGRAARTHRWTASVIPNDQFPWFGWMPAAHLRRSRAAGAPSTKRIYKPVYKLYVSARPECARDALLVAAPEVFRSRALALKTGAGLHGVLRPDKMVAYFRSHDDLADAAMRLRQQLRGLTAHGVPFTTSIGTDGLLSWGIDPPSASGDDPVKRQSW